MPKRLRSSVRKSAYAAVEPGQGSTPNACASVPSGSRT